MRRRFTIDYTLTKSVPAAGDKHYRVCMQGDLQRDPFIRKRRLDHYMRRFLHRDICGVLGGVHRQSGAFIVAALCLQFYIHVEYGHVYVLRLQ